MSNIWVALLLLMEVACSHQHLEQVAVHDFGSPHPANGIKSATKPELSVDAPEWLQDNRIRYRLLYASPTQVRFYALDRWIATPAQLFEQKLLASGKLPGGQLSVRLLDFEQQFDAPDRARAVLRFSLTTSEEGKSDHLTTRIISLEQPTITPDAKGAVNAFAHLAQQAVNKTQELLTDRMDAR
ncbi:MAG: hypothetical protein Q7U57_20340 [Methylovulum sp.]|nr:hypothetical protein [Methylovulum sp.]